MNSAEKTGIILQEKNTLKTLVNRCKKSLMPFKLYIRIPYSASYLRVKRRELAADLYKRQCFLDNIQILTHEAGKTAKEITKHTGC